MFGETCLLPLDLLCSDQTPHPSWPWTDVLTKFPLRAGSPVAWVEGTVAFVLLFSQEHWWFKKISLLCECFARMHVNAPCTCFAYRGQRASDSLDLELQGCENTLPSSWWTPGKAKCRLRWYWRLWSGHLGGGEVWKAHIRYSATLEDRTGLGCKLPLVCCNHLSYECLTTYKHTHTMVLACGVHLCARVCICSIEAGG